MRIEREIEIERPVEEVFAFVADARNDPRWCRKVRSVEQIEGDGPGPGARYAVVHRPIPLRPARRLDMRCTAFQEPHRIEWTEEDSSDRFEVVYELSASPDGGTRMRQRSDAEVGVPRPLHGIMRAGIGRDIAGQLTALKKLLEGR